MRIFIIILFTTFTQAQKMGDIKAFTLIKNISIEMVFVEAGEFMMGSPLSEEGRNKSRENLHKVKITKGFWIARTEMIQKIWEEIMKSNPSKIREAQHPVERVSYHQIQEFLHVINKGQSKFRLPYEAEWEYACRAGSKKAYYGDIEATTWHRNNSEKTSHPVAKKEPNSLGLFDMQGNVSEICEDWLEDYLSNAVDPKGPSDGDYKVLRGGQYTGRVRHTRSADRQRIGPDEALFFAGFRLVRVN